MHRKIIYLLNPFSGTKKKFSLAKLLSDKTAAAAIDFEIANTNARGDYADLRLQVEKEDITDVVVCGGDGSVSAVAAALLGCNVRIGIIPMGSGNGLALAAKISPDPVKALDIIFKGHASWIDGFYINKQFSCMLCGIGFDAKVAHDFSKQKKRGLQTYIKVSLINLFKAKPYRFEIVTLTRTISTEAFFISIANSNQFGNQFTIAPMASLADGLLDIVIVKKMNKLVLPFAVLAQVTGMNAMQQLSEYVDKRNIIYFQTDHLTIINTDNALLHIDGDPKNASEKFEIKVVSQAMQLIQP
jgi:YegS/Rv2252/BmrU family lipid kinase